MTDWSISHNYVLFYRSVKGNVYIGVLLMMAEQNGYHGWNIAFFGMAPILGKVNVHMTNIRIGATLMCILACFEFEFRSFYLALINHISWGISQLKPIRSIAYVAYTFKRNYTLIRLISSLCCVSYNFLVRVSVNSGGAEGNPGGKVAEIKGPRSQSHFFRPFML